jgi:hypothetical protein
MPNSDAKKNGEKIALVLKAWKEISPDKSFAGMTLEQFTAKVQPSLDAREKIDELGENLIAAQTDLDNADVVSMKQVNLVVNAVKGDPTEGEDGALYAGMGYIRKSDRKTGKTNKSKPQPAAAK